MKFRSNEIDNWYQSLAGRFNSKLIISHIDKIFNTSPDKNIIYFGPKEIVKKLLENNNNYNTFYVSLSEHGDLSAEIQKLPFQESSIDNIVLIHSLDINESPHAAFREIDRIIKDDGQIIIAGFNRVSPLAIYSILPFKSIFKNKDYVGINRLHDWMSLFSYEVQQIININKIPPVKNENILKYFKFLNNSFFSKINYFGISYIFFAKKKTYKFILNKNWHKRDNIILGKFSKPVIHNNYER
tara:strand:+ start:362 stop:1087 length:726 start_codon:yes stop_codon:yes gene_type:complete